MHNKSKLLLALTIASLMMLSISCRKTELANSVTQGNGISSVENNFFRSHRSGDSEENTIVNYLIRRNVQKHFIEETVEKIGYPRWDKIIKSNSEKKSPFLLKVQQVSLSKKVNLS